MGHPQRWFATAALLLAGLPASAQVSLPQLWSVHIDRVITDSAQRFEALDAAQARARTRLFRRAGIPLPLAYTIATGDGRYLTLRPRASYAELDKKFPDSINATMRKDVNPYSDTVHGFLEGHNSELWTLDRELSWIPERAGPITGLHIVSETVKPPLDAAYDSLASVLYGAVKRSDRPFGALVFFSSLGTGGYRHLWLSPAAADFTQLTTALFGSEGGAAFRKRWQACLLASEEYDARARPELTDLPGNEPFLGIR